MGLATTKMLRPALLVLGLFFASWGAQAEGWPPITEITFSGNSITRPETMLRELLVHVGDPADPGQVERSRQAVQDLGLFRSVAVERESVNGGVRLTFTVREKWYVLPLPRVEGNSNGDYGYGGQLRWNNLWGLNHTLQLQAVKRKFQASDRSGQLSYNANYYAPFIGDSRYSLSAGVAHIDQDSLDPLGRRYNEKFDSAQLLTSYALSSSNPSHGWSVGGGLQWQRDTTSGQFALPGQGQATALADYVSYNDLRYLIYSEEGQIFNAGLQVAVNGLASDYYYSNYQASYRHDWHIGDTPHQTAQLLARVGSYSGGGSNRIHNAYSVGGAKLLRGYVTDTAKGDFGYYLSGAYLRPVYWDWLRLLVVAEAGSAYPTFRSTGGRPIFASLGVGLRLRITFLVNVEVEAGVAFPLIDGNGARLFAGPV